jgi:putative ABC transport system permease protein
MALIIIAFLIGEFSYDRSYPNIEHIYRVFADDNMASVREDFRELFLEKYPSVEDACRYNNYEATVTYEEKPFKGQMIVTDASFFNIFSTQFLTGSKESSLVNLNDAVITESFARQIFGDADPIGKTLIAEYETPLVVSGIVKDFPVYSSIRGDIFTNSKKKIIYESSSDGMGNDVYFFRMFLLLKNADNISVLESLITTDLSAVKYNFGSVEKIKLIPFDESYFMQGIERSQTLHSNLKLIKLLSLISAIIILLAVFNYINLITATHTGRFREIGIKKTVGATRWQIFSQFIGESFFICLISFMLALFLSSFWTPFFERFLGSSINLSNLYQPLQMIWLLCGVTVISVISGFYPALSISKLKPITILMKRNARKHTSLGLRAVLNIFQYAVSISLIIALTVLSRQIEYVRTKDYGYDADKLLRVDLHWRLSDKTGVIKNELLSDPSVKSVCFSHGSPGSIYLTSSWEPLGGKDEIISVMTADSAFFKVFRIPAVNERELLSSDFNKVCYINETAYKKTGWDSFEGKKFQSFEIIGIVNDFHYADMHNKIGPLAILISSGMGVSHLTLRVSPDNIPQTINTLKETWKKVCPGHELNYKFYDEWLASMYKNEERLVAAIRFFAVLAIMISCLGILGLAEFSIKRRIKEIGIRKVNGARVAEIITLLNKDFIKWVLIAFIIAAPVSWYVMNLWLENFAYRTGLSWWIFALAGLIAMAIALLTVSWQSLRAATRNPVEALRYE